ncbi:hypothetical protein SNEBB_008752 [Seison nebaliae]|nr:hypothetical protein SNEBB_008752 [Seison nebaliae]
MFSSVGNIFNSVVSTVQQTINGEEGVTPTDLVDKCNRVLETCVKSVNDSTKFIKSEAVAIAESVLEEEPKFLTENEKLLENRRQVVLPWVGYTKEEQLRECILEISKEESNFLRPPPSSILEEETSYDDDDGEEKVNEKKFLKVSVGRQLELAKMLLKEDDNLKKIRYELVPKKINENDFWRNYFYRVSLVKNSILSTPDETNPVQSPSEKMERDESKKENDDSDMVKVEEIEKKDQNEDDEVEDWEEALLNGDDNENDEAAVQMLNEMLLTDK